MRQRLVVVAVVILLCSVATPALSQDERTPILRLKELKAEHLAAHPQATAVAMAAKTVNVDCKKGDTISAALAQNTGPVVIKVRGTCRENVRIERGDVTLLGTDPARDGIQGVTANPQPSAAVELYYANRIRLENISVSDSPGRGVGAWWSSLEMLNCRIERNAGVGTYISASSSLAGTELVSSSNRTGIHAGRASFVTCFGCQLEGNTRVAVQSIGGQVTLLDSVVSGDRGIEAVGPGSYVDVDCGAVVSSYPCSIHVVGAAAHAVSGGIANLYFVGEFGGSLTAEGGEVGVYGGEQTLPAESSNYIFDLGRLLTGYVEQNGPLTKLGATTLAHFSRAILYSPLQLAGDLICESGSDAWSDTAQPASKVINCENVPTYTPTLTP